MEATKKSGKLRGGVLSLVTEVALLFLSSLLFALSFPSFLSINGWSILAFIALAPIVPVIRRSGWIKTILYGPFYAFLCYSLFNYWLAKFHPAATLVVNVIYMSYFILLFPALKLAEQLFKEKAFWLQAAIWLAYEYLRTRGFAGYAYGIIGYSQYANILLIQIADIFGVWGVSILVVFPSFYFGRLILLSREEQRFFLTRQKAGLITYGAFLVLTFIYGLAAQVDYQDAPHKKIALIQHDIDPWKGGFSAFSQGLDHLITESEKALEQEPDLVVWSETAFVPAIDYHSRYRENRRYYNLIQKLTSFLEQQTIPFVIGNDHAERAKNEEGRIVRVDYNGVRLWDNGFSDTVYKKIHLVPFTEYFPYKKSLPFIYEYLLNADTHFWEKGEEYIVFNAGGISFSTPICFEDTFGYLARGFVNNGADLIVNVTNDSWSFSVASMMQHLSISVFRSVENRRTLVRASNGGMTAVVDPNGKVLASLEPFTRDNLVYSTPIYKGNTTLYTRWGDWFAYLCLVVVFLLIGWGVVKRR